jgi:hypothetical protein
MSYSLDSTSKFFRQTVTTPVITTKKVCQSSALGTDGTILRTSISLRILERSSLSSAKECLVYLLYVVWSCYYQTSSFKNARFANWQDTPTRIIVTYSFMLQSVCQIPSSKKQSFVTISTQKRNKFPAVPGLESGHSNAVIPRLTGDPANEFFG